MTGFRTIGGPVATGPAALEMDRLLAQAAGLVLSRVARTPADIVRLVDRRTYPLLSSGTDWAQTVSAVAQAVFLAAGQASKVTVSGPALLTTLQVEFQGLTDALRQGQSPAALAHNLPSLFPGLASVIANRIGFLAEVTRAVQAGGPALSAVYERWTGEPAITTGGLTVGFDLGDVAAIANIAAAFVPAFTNDRTAQNIASIARAGLNLAAGAEAGNVKQAVEQGAEIAKGLANQFRANPALQQAFDAAAKVGVGVAEREKEHQLANSQRTAELLRQQLGQAQAAGNQQAAQALWERVQKVDAQAAVDELELRQLRGEKVQISSELKRVAQYGPIRNTPAPAIPVAPPPQGIPAMPVPPAPPPRAAAPEPARPVPPMQVPPPWSPGQPAARAAAPACPADGPDCPRSYGPLGTLLASQAPACCAITPTNRGVLLTTWSEGDARWPGPYQEVPAGDYYAINCDQARQVTPIEGVVRMPGLPAWVPCLPGYMTQVGTVIVPPGWDIDLFDQPGLRGNSLSLLPGTHNLVQKGWSARVRSMAVRGPWTMMDGLVYRALVSRTQAWATHGLNKPFSVSNVVNAIVGDPSRPLPPSSSDEPLTEYVSSYGPGWMGRLATVARSNTAWAMALRRHYAALGR